MFTNRDVKQMLTFLRNKLFVRINTERKDRGLGPMKIPLLADPTQAISRDYGVLKEDEGIAYRGLFVIDDKGIPRQIPINDLPVGCSVDETLHLVQAFQHTDKFGEEEGTENSVPSRMETRERHHRPKRPEEQGVFLQTELIHPHLLRGATSIQG
ncbi:peroxiredoxin-2-like isoform X2 [Oncorhynchus keta]|nr:peroxiredoxin-2-like isoform X2 [Oncorhynchus keta]